MNKMDSVPTAEPGGNEPLLRAVMPELDSIRGMAILAVLIYHEFYIAAAGYEALPRWQHLFITLTWCGRLGVNLFFVLSGFLITGLLIGSREKPNYYKRFYIRRALRIFPIYFALLLVLVLARYPLPFILLSLGYLSNLTPLFGVGIAYPVLWSLAVEEHFYLLWPFLVRRLSQIRLMRLAIAIVVASPLVRLVSFYWSGQVDINWAFYTWNNFDGLACGAVLALFIRQTQQSRKALSRVCWIAFGLTILLWIVGLPFGIETRYRPVGAALQVVPWQFLFFALTGAFLLIGTSPWRSIVQSRFLGFFGYISYGLYLIHALVFSGLDKLTEHAHVPGYGHGPFADLVVRAFYGGGAAILLAWLSRKYFEAPFLRMKREA